jgi:hypothetical protein
MQGHADSVDIGLDHVNRCVRRRQATEVTAMYVRILSFEARHDLASDEVAAVYHDVIDAVGEFDGFLGSTLLMSEDTHRGMAMTFWRDAGCASDAAPRYLEIITPRIYDLVEHPPSIDGFDVLDESLFASRNGARGRD